MIHALAASLRKTMPFSLVRLTLRLLFRVEVNGLAHLQQSGKRTLLIANHVSSLDALLLSAFLPEKMLFATHKSIADRGWLHPYWLNSSDVLLDQANPMTAKLMVDALRQNKPCMIFPEGRITRTGALMKVYESPGMIADKADAAILAVRIDGPQYSMFSSLEGAVKRRLFPKITLTILPAQKLDLPPEEKGHKRRLLAGRKIYDILERAMVEGVSYQTLLNQFMESKPIRGGKGIALEDTTRKPLSHNAFAASFFALAQALGRQIARDEKNVALMMPNGVPNATTLFAIQALGRVTAMINFTSGPLRISQACHMASIKTIITLRSFVEEHKLTSLLASLEEKQIRFLFLEDLLATMSAQDRALAWIKARVPPQWATANLSRNTDDPALLLFTSGTEGSPKGVVLSHRNIIANCFQTGVRLGFSARDSSFASLPMFHSFGLTLGVFMPLFYGTRAFLYPSPLRYHDIPELVYDTGATLLLGTDTFLAGYAHNATPHDFYFLRFAIGGAEKIKPETRRVWAEKFGVRLLEGYGTTEASPVIGMNAPLFHKPGSIGRALAGIDVKLNPVEGINEGAELVVRGPNLMLGYLSDENPNQIQPLQEGWYNTGDVVSVDDSGFITIVGRTKRFAKIAGEMISLASIETVISSLWPDSRHVAVAVPDTRKGEKIVILTESDKLDLGLLPEHFRLYGLTELSVPRKMIKVAQIPMLGSGKTDYAYARKLAIEETENTNG